MGRSVRSAWKMPDFPQTEHGKRARYVQGCRCELCTTANREYARARARAKVYGKTNELVKARKARSHLRKLAKAGVGTRMVADLTGCSRSILLGIKQGVRKNCRKKTQDRILSVDPGVYGDATLVDAAPTWVLLNELLEDGWTKTELGRQLGSKAKVPSLQVKKTKIMASTERRVRQLHKRLSLPPTSMNRDGSWTARCCGEEYHVSALHLSRCCPKCQESIDKPTELME
jgi:hypothetical protein